MTYPWQLVLVSGFELRKDRFLLVLTLGARTIILVLSGCPLVSVDTMSITQTLVFRQAEEEVQIFRGDALMMFLLLLICENLDQGSAFFFLFILFTRCYVPRY